MTDPKNFNLTKFFFGKNFNATSLTGSLVRSIFYFGYPIKVKGKNGEHFKDKSDRETE
jgi:hypothetical protein